LLFTSGGPSKVHILNKTTASAVSQQQFGYSNNMILPPFHTFNHNKRAAWCM
jgi:hypothetical protein